MEKSMKRIFLWQDPVRSGTFFVLIMGFLYLSKSYSLIQITAACLTVAIAVNLAYVNISKYSQRVMSDGPGVNPYQSVLDDEQHLATVNRSSLQSSLDTLATLGEHLAQKLARIVLVEDTKTSIKWCAVFYLTWKLAAYVPGRVLAMIATLVAFTAPVFYAHNQEVIDTRFSHVGETLSQQWSKVESQLQENWHRFFSSARFRFSKLGTSSTDAKNSMLKTSVTLKEE
ncbi:hypothetical protein DM01DRAFT_1319333 [Hesseltinella vesiculosa]|uniref:Reticulon-like protein n=1 Tax=Hesseltinella vesiculosa TaxID=101127 RepID=A0A1X2GMV8_9FUNG|nr:hypothetical protein DM01DRAFT_1319333 [Hesseltinella vesiculosa]